MAETMRLWEADHAYYCNEGNYYAPGNSQPYARYKSWAAFIADEGDSDMDYNLLFRWDWREGEGWELAPYNGDDNYRNGLLLLYWIGQRKGLFRWTEIEVCRADEPAVREWLAKRFTHLMALWAPFAAESTHAE